MGHVYRRGNKLWIAYKGPDGERSRHPTPFKVGQEGKAEKLLSKVEAKVAAGLVPEEGPLTLERYARRWVAKRKALGLADWKNDEARLDNHVLSDLGKLRLDEVRPRHLAELFQAMRTKPRKGKPLKGKRGRHTLAPKTVRHVYSAVTALFRDAVIEDLIPSSPCILTKYQLGPIEDANPEWRATALFTRDELERLISDEQIPLDRRVLYALEGIAALRHGEAAGLRWRHYEPDMKPLGRLTVATSYNKGRTKTGRTRYMPVHPTLAAILAEWKLSGWRAMMGRKPGPDDLVVPTPPPGKYGKRPAGEMRKADRSWEALQGDLDTLKMRRRRAHDLRRTLISLARMDGARGEMLKACTHGPSKAVLDLYTTFTWESLCAEVAKLKVSRGTREEVVALPQAAVAGCADSADSAPTASSSNGEGTGDDSADCADSALRVARDPVAEGEPLVEPQWPATHMNHDTILASPTGFEPVSPA